MTLRSIACLGLLAAGCGKSATKHDAAPGNDDADRQDDAMVTADAAGCALTPPPLAACANPVSGSTVTMQLLHPLGGSGGGAMLVTSPKNDPRLFIVERGGTIRISENGTLKPTPFIDLSDVLTSSGSEQGLLGMAFHPAYACNRTFYVFYTQSSSASIVAACTASTGDPNDADDACTPILTIRDFASNHNGGMLEFGQDGYLYIGTGDGGDMGDPQRAAQDPDDLLGKILRIDVDTTANGKMYGIPADNPYASGGGAPEVFILGLRNPWRWSFDKQTGDLWIGDVGQDATEELSVLRPAEQRGANLGWSVYEGNSCCDTQGDNCRQSGTQYACSMTGLVFPKFTHSHGSGWISIIAGEVYRGTCYPDLVGWHFYTDHSSAAEGLQRARLRVDGQLDIEALGTTLANGAASIHADARGELYMTTTGGGVYALRAGP